MLAHRLKITNPQDYGLYSLKSPTGVGMLAFSATYNSFFAFFVTNERVVS